MRTTIERRGNGGAIRIPAKIIRAARLEVGQEVEIREENGRVMIGPVRYQQFDLDEPVAGITPDNRHDLIDFGDPVGREAW